MRNFTLPVIKIICILLFCFAMPSCKKENSPVATTAMKVQLGKTLFNDKTLSNPSGQSCGSCHSPLTGFSDPNHNIVSPGAVDGLFGNRNAISIAYSTYTPTLHYSIDDSSYVGGFFMDGRVNTLQEQAQKPFLNPLEMGNTDASMVVSRLRNSASYGQFKQTYGVIADDNTAFQYMVEAISAFESSSELNPFTSKFDYYLQGQASLTSEELSGMKLFSDTLKSKCSTCHLITPDPVSGKILFTDHTYNNDGVPANPNNPYYFISTAFNPLGSSYVDLGLGAIINDPDYYGAFKVPTLRNIAISAPYFHNGYFNTLEDVVHFYNVRDTTGGNYPPAEYAPTVDHEDTGNQHLSAKEESDIVAFLKTLTDGYE